MENNSLYLSSPVNALVEGLYEENISLSEIKKHGNFGLGTFNNLDGEMVLLDNQFFQVRGNGQVEHITKDLLTPFACTCFFNPLSHDTLTNESSYDNVLAFINDLMPSSNIFYAIRIDGSFSYIKTRSVPRQENYAPLVDVAKNQPTFEFKNIKGTLAGFYTPSFMSSINVPGLHLHFISEDRNSGGHLLSCSVENVNIGIQYLTNMNLSLPLTFDYLTSSFERDIEQDLHKAEK